MKKKIAIFLTLTLSATASLAQTNVSEMTTTKEENIVSSQGFRIGLSVPMLHTRISASFGQPKSNIDEVDSTIGFSLGYISLPVQKIGWTTNLTHMNLKGSSTVSQLSRLDGNLAYAFTDVINVKGGLNLSKLTAGTFLVKLDPVLGFQTVLGIQITKGLGIDIGYTQMNQSGSVNGRNISSMESGAELNLNGTF